jgi:glycosyltransferase involved in cell wall biosynthesis
MKTLIFLTDRFPYGRGETFVENEIPYIAKEFDNVILIPTSIAVNTKRERKLPSNVFVVSPSDNDDIFELSKCSRFRKMIWGIKKLGFYAFLSLFDKNLYDELHIAYNERCLNLYSVINIFKTTSTYKRSLYKYHSYLDDIEQNEDIFVYSYWANTPLLYYLNYLKKNRAVRKAICRAHRIDLYKDQNRGGYIPFQKRTIQTVDNYILISKDGFDYILDNYREFKSKFSVDYLGTKDYGVGIHNEKDPFVIVSCALVSSVKRIDKLVSALSLIDDYNIKWIHIGDGPDFQALCNYAKQKLNNKRNISYELKGYMTNENIMDFYKHNNTNLFVNTSSSEGLPVSIMEAISFGMPVIATDVGSTREIVIEGKNGRLLPSYFDDAQLANYVGDYVKMDFESYRYECAFSRKMWKEKFYDVNNYTKFVIDYLR